MFICNASLFRFIWRQVRLWSINPFTPCLLVSVVISDFGSILWRTSLQKEYNLETKHTYNLSVQHDIRAQAYPNTLIHLVLIKLKDVYSRTKKVAHRTRPSTVYLQVRVYVGQRLFCTFQCQKYLTCQETVLYYLRCQKRYCIISMSAMQNNNWKPTRYISTLFNYIYINITKYKIKYFKN